LGAQYNNEKFNNKIKLKSLINQIKK